jgi:SAM-dependent methyltransferase
MLNTRITRWDKWYSEENLREDERILAAPPSQCAQNAARAFLSQGNRLILDLACGVGRDTRYLERRGLVVVGVDASVNGLRVARERVLSEGGACAEWVAEDARQLPEPLGLERKDGMVRIGAVHYNAVDEIRRLGDALREMAP